MRWTRCGCDCWSRSSARARFPAPPMSAAWVSPRPPSTWVAERVARRDVSLGLAGEIDFPDGVVAESFLDDEVVGIAAPDQLKLRRGRASLKQLADKTLQIGRATCR